MNEVKVPLWIVIAVFGAVLSVGGWSAQAVLDLRDRETRTEARVAALESSGNDTRALPLAIAKLEAKMDGLTAEVSQLREDLRRTRAPGPNTR